MKKKYVEPQMIVEDFKISEMVARNCTLTPEDVNVVSQMSTATPPCKGLQEFIGTDKYDIYFQLDNAYDGEFDLDADGHGTFFDGTYDADDYAFTDAYKKASNKSTICNTDPFEHGGFSETFPIGSCVGDDRPLMNS